MTPQTLLLSLNAACTLVLGGILLVIKGELADLRAELPGIHAAAAQVQATAPPQPLPSMTQEANPVVNVNPPANPFDIDPARDWFTPKEVSLQSRFAVSERAVQEWCLDGKIAGAEKVGGFWRIPRDYELPR